MSGWIKLHRQILESDLWKSEPFTRGQAWVDLLLLANHSKGFIRARGIKIDVNRGQVGMSQVELSKRWQWSRGKTRRFLDELETEQQIVQQKNNVSSLISITNYEQYQGDGTADSTPDGQQTEQQTDSKRYTNKKNNNNKEEKEPIKSKPKKSPTIEERAKSFCDELYSEWHSLGGVSYLSRLEIENFFAYWTEKGSKDVKFRFEKEKTFGIVRRLGTWKRNNFNPIKTTANQFNGSQPSSGKYIIRAEDNVIEPQKDPGY